MKKYFSWTGIIFVILYGFWVLSVYFQAQNCTEFLCNFGTVMKTLMPGLIVITPFESMIKSQSYPDFLLAVCYLINVLFYYSVGLLISKVNR